MKKQTSKSKHPTLSALELDVMDVVWDLGECTSAQVIDAFQSRRPLAPTTIRTVLTNLRNKGYVEALPALERGYKFRASIGREDVARRSLKDMLPSLFQNSPIRAISYLIEDAGVSDDELDEIRRMIDKQKRGGRKPKGGKK